MTSFFSFYKIQKTRKVCLIQYAGKWRQKFKANTHEFGKKINIYEFHIEFDIWAIRK